MEANYPAAEALVLVDEGLFSDNPKDPGGPTNLGVDQETLSQFLGRPATVAEVRALTPAAVAPIYATHYWRPIRGDEMPSGLDYFVFDSAVQHGVERAIKILQRALDVPADGLFGGGTMLAIRGAKDVAGLIATASAGRLAFYRSLRTFPTFGHGWTARLERVTATAIAWARRGSA
jgi:lysozyme family protein